MGCKVIKFSSLERKKIYSINSTLFEVSINWFSLIKYNEINTRIGNSNNKIFLFLNLLLKIKKKPKTVTGNHATTKSIIIINE